MAEARPERRSSLEVWAGVECTVNRVGDVYLDQLNASGHATRPEDLVRFAQLGINALRYPLLWERLAPGWLQEVDWSWADDRLARLRALGVRPIVGLVHHGSGPRHTSLVDPFFPEGLAHYARAVAKRYPWIEDYTPVNEPLTTARFSGLYGHWYPHGRDPLTFARALLTECRATVLAMQAIREVNPAARLVQTEDMGKTFSTPTLAYQADFENERRWLTFDLLCGRLDRRHPQWGYLRWVGVAESELTWFLDHPCPPDLLGLNYYVTSERFLDERLERYPACCHGGNGRHSYADVEAVRVRAEGLAGPAALLGEAWARFRLPLALTEVHLGCTREEQLRWLVEVWDEAQAARAAGVDVRAVTAWSLLGSFDWDSLVTRQAGHYEPGVFDLRGPQPRPTALAGLLADLAAGRRPRHPVLATAGWWRRPQRLLYPPVGNSSEGKTSPGPHRPAARPVLIVGGRGTVTQTLARLCEQRGLVYRLLSDRDVDLADRASVEDCLTRRQPWAVVDVTGWESGNEAEGEPRRCSCANRPRPAVLAEACCGREVALLILAPGLCSCAHSSPEALVVRRNTSVGLPALIEEQVNTCLDLLLDGEQGVWQLSHTGSAPGTFPAQQVESTLGKGTEGTGARFMRESRGEGKTLPAPPADRSLPFPWPVPYNEP